MNDNKTNGELCPECLPFHIALVGVLVFLKIGLLHRNLDVKAFLHDFSTPSAALANAFDHSLKTQFSLELPDAQTRSSHLQSPQTQPQPQPGTLGTKIINRLPVRTQKQIVVYHAPPQTS